MAARMKREQRLAFETEVWEMRRKGKSIPTIAAALGIAMSTVHDMLRRVATQYNKDLMEQVAEQRAEQCAQLDHLIEEALTEWERSKGNAEVTRTTTKKLGARKVEEKREPQAHGGELKRRREVADVEVSGMYLNGETGEETTAEERAELLAAAARAGVNLTPEDLTVVEQNQTVESKWQCGDPRYLAEARALYQAKRDILGLDAPKRTELTTDPDKPIVVKVVKGVSMDDI